MLLLLLVMMLLCLLHAELRNLLLLLLKMLRELDAHWLHPRLSGAHTCELCRIHARVHPIYHIHRHPIKLLLRSHLHLLSLPGLLLLLQ